MRPEIHGGGSLLAFAASALLATAATAQEPGSRQTRDFVQAAAESDTFEIMEGQTALAQSSDPGVRHFAQQMIDAHRQTTQTLLQAVAKAGLQPPHPGMSGDQAMFLASLQSQRGADFDHAYLRQQRLAHSAALAMESGYARTGDDGTIRQLAASSVPIITAHLNMAEQMAKESGGS
jgi:putative membrane protein